MSLITIGKNLTRTSLEEEALGKLKLAKQWNTELKFGAKAKVKQIEESKKLIEESIELAKKLDIERATANFNKAIEFDPKATLKVSDPQNKAQIIVGNTLITEAKTLAKQGNIQQAINRLVA